MDWNGKNWFLGTKKIDKLAERTFSKRRASKTARKSGSLLSHLIMEENWGVQRGWEFLWRKASFWKGWANRKWVGFFCFRDPRPSILGNPAMRLDWINPDVDEFLKSPPRWEPPDNLSPLITRGYRLLPEPLFY